jgi:adenosylcobinamide-GDP ribazoletransferase
LLAAVAFLTRVPVGRRMRDVSSGAALFPAVGAAVGAAVGGSVYGLAQVVPALAAAGAGLAVGALATGALHLDALADTADALAAHSRESALAIMRDHAIGTYGAVALVLDLTVKAAALAAIAGRGAVVLAAVAAGALSRAVPVVLAATLPGLRTEGAGAAFRPTLLAACAAAALAAAAAAPVEPLLIGVAGVTAAASWLHSRRWLGGRSGDTLGAAAELTETAVLVAAAALL